MPMTPREQIEQLMAENPTAANKIHGGYDLTRFGVSQTVLVMSGTVFYKSEDPDESKRGTFRAWHWNKEIKEFERLSEDFYPDRAACLEAIVLKLGGSFCP